MIGAVVRRIYRSGLITIRFLLLACTSFLGGVADSVMSPYFCPLAREHGMGSTMCGLVISARFGTQIIFLLLFGRLMRNVGARKIYLFSMGMFAVFNMLLVTIVLVTDDQIFAVMSFLLVILSTIGDAGIFSSIYVLAGQEQISLGCGKQKKKETNASGPAWMEATYACGSMLGPPIGGLIYIAGGFGAIVLTTGLCMALVGLFICLAYSRDHKPNQENVSATIDNENQNDCQAKDERKLETISSSVQEIEITDENTKESNKRLTYFKAISSPVISSCCIIQISSGIASSWYLSSLESHLTQTMGLTTAQVGLVYMSPGLVYMLLTPVFGFLLDKGFKHIPILILATTANFLGYLLIGPSSLLPGLSPHPGYTVVGLLLHGLGLSATLMTCMSFMMDSTDNLEDESNAGIVSSLWTCCEMIGGYLGSTFGGLSADRYGFRGGTSIVIIIESVVLGLLITMLLLTYCGKRNAAIKHLGDSEEKKSEGNTLEEDTRE